MWFFYEKPSLFSLSHTRWLSLLYLTDWLTLFSFSKGYESHFKKVKVGSEIDFCMTRQVLVSEGMRLPIGMLISNLDVFKHWNSGGGSFVIGNVKRLHQFSSLWLKKTNVANLFLMGQPRPLFNLFSSFQIHIAIFTTNTSEKMSIRYTVPGFKLTTFGTWVSQ